MTLPNPARSPLPKPWQPPRRGAWMPVRDDPAPFDLAVERATRVARDGREPDHTAAAAAVRMHDYPHLSRFLAEAWRSSAVMFSVPTSAQYADIIPRRRRAPGSAEALRGLPTPRGTFEPLDGRVAIDEDTAALLERLLADPRRFNFTTQAAMDASSRVSWPDMERARDGFCLVFEQSFAALGSGDLSRMWRQWDLIQSSPGSRAVHEGFIQFAAEHFLEESLTRLDLLKQCPALRTVVGDGRMLRPLAAAARTLVEEAATVRYDGFDAVLAEVVRGRCAPDALDDLLQAISRRELGREKRLKARQSACRAFGALAAEVGPARPGARVPYWEATGIERAHNLSQRLRGPTPGISRRADHRLG